MWKKSRELHSRFPVRRIEYELDKADQICGECGDGLKIVPTESHRYLDYVPAHFETIEEVVYVYNCKSCKTMVRAAKEPSLLRGSIATPSLVAAIMKLRKLHSI